MIIDVEQVAHLSSWFLSSEKEDILSWSHSGKKIAL